MVYMHKTKTGRGKSGEGQLWHCCFCPPGISYVLGHPPHTPPIRQFRPCASSRWLWYHMGGCLVHAPGKSGLLREKSSLEWERTCPKARSCTGPSRHQKSRQTISRGVEAAAPGAYRSLGRLLPPDEMGSHSRLRRELEVRLLLFRSRGFAKSPGPDLHA